MKKIEKGDLTASVEENTNDEIGELATIFNGTMLQISLLIDQLKEQHRISMTYEMKLMQEQLKPHFLYNTIESIVSLINLKMYEQATEVALKLSSFYRLILNNGENLINIHDEMRITENYLYLQKIRYIEYLDYKIEFDKSIFDYQIPKMTIQPIVENAIYHGIRKIRTKGIIEVRVKQGLECLIIEVYDNGVGMTQDKIKYLLKSKPNKGHEFGFFSVRERLRLLFGDAVKIEIDSEIGKYCCVRIKLPIREPEGGSSNE